MTPTLHAVTSADGTRIAYERYGTADGVPVVLVGGAMNDRSTVAGLATALTRDVPAVCYDRRGRGDSGTAPGYAVAREVEDLAALVAAVGGVADLVGHSSGACLAIEAVLAGVPVRRLAVYEPPYLIDQPWDARPRPVDLGPRVQALVALDRLDEATTLFLTEAAAAPDDVVAGMRADAALWEWVRRLAPTLPHDLALFGADQSIPDPQRLTGIAVPTLAMAGGASPEWLQAGAARVAELVPGARHLTVPGEDHYVLARPEVLGPLVLEFLG